MDCANCGAGEEPVKRCVAASRAPSCTPSSLHCPRARARALCNIARSRHTACPPNAFPPPPSPPPAINFARYKIVVQSVVGQQKQQGVRVASRCLWDTDTDNFSTYTYTNDTLWCTVMCFGLYSE